MCVDLFVGVKNTGLHYSVDVEAASRGDDSIVHNDTINRGHPGDRPVHSERRGCQHVGIVSTAQNDVGRA